MIYVICEEHERWIYSAALYRSPDLPLSLWKGRILSGWFWGGFGIWNTLGFRGFCWDPSVSWCSIVGTTGNVFKEVWLCIIVEWSQPSSKQFWCNFLLHLRASKVKAEKQKTRRCCNRAEEKTKHLQNTWHEPHSICSQISKIGVQVKEAGNTTPKKAKCARTTIPGSDGGKDRDRWWRWTVGRCATEMVLGNGDFIHWTNYLGGWVWGTSQHPLSMFFSSCLSFSVNRKRKIRKTNKSTKTWEELFDTTSR